MVRKNKAHKLQGQKALNLNHMIISGFKTKESGWHIPLCWKGGSALKTVLRHKRGCYSLPMLNIKCHYKKKIIKITFTYPS